MVTQYMIFVEVLSLKSALLSMNVLPDLIIIPSSAFIRKKETRSVSDEEAGEVQFTKKYPCSPDPFLQVTFRFECIQPGTPLWYLTFRVFGSGFCCWIFGRG